ncbi:ABC transporter permease [Tessaracoccus sp. OH4464_COT-324]|uniref:ABC transporter permease n=1 Tax=Tessaracoccus sp. OH4464_COT-324 TaxID=2491059 RepID=UPI000F6428EF|nr:ABC transporter permease subunit [Tessaracoccus sp. OH4464_COT-324]RRD47993.1 ABC transporter permease subunit [Tessaracoccus sp. OH4464_COT-324]
MTLFVEALRWLIDTSHWTGSGSIPQRLVEHFSLSLVTVALAAFLALPVGVYIGHTGRGAGVVGAVAGVARAIPTLGLLTIFGLALGIGVVAPALALIVLAVPSLLAGAYAGIHAIEPAVPAAAKAIGMSPMQVVRRVEIPLALPVMIGGLRSATLQVVATATLAAYTADVGLGRYLFSGLKSRDYAQMLGGSLLVIGLALLMELGLMLLQRFARRKADPAK